MKTLQNLAAILIALALLAGFGYGLYAGYLHLEHQWKILDFQWKPLIILGGAIAFLCALLIVWAVFSGARKNQTATGKGIAYDTFIDWYSALIHNSKGTSAESFITIRNRMALWAGNDAAQAADILYNALKDKQSHEALLKYADDVFQEMKKEAGNRGAKEYRKMV